MKFNPSHIFLILPLLLLFGATNNPMSIVKVTPNKTSFEAGDPILLSFDLPEISSPILYYTYSYGTSAITPVIDGHTASFTLPTFVSNKKGTVTWKLINQSKTIKTGGFTIKAKHDVSTIETYLGPIFMQAGNQYFGHLVSIPTDVLDNPTQDDTEVLVNQQFYTKKSSSVIKTKHLIAFEEIYTRTKTGRISINSFCKGISSKELSTEIYSANPVSYLIDAKTNHPYADGNQLVTLSTSPIKDQYDNLIVDGTFVKFIIQNNDKYLLHANGTTINGVATAKINHPNQQDNWKIHSFISGMAESNEIELTFLPAISDFTVSFSKSNRNITVGPIKSYMNQLIPDGLDIQLKIYRQGKLIHTIHRQSYDGLGLFILNNSSLDSGIYDVEVSLGGLAKSFKNIKI